MRGPWHRLSARDHAERFSTHTYPSIPFIISSELFCFSARWTAEAGGLIAALLGTRWSKMGRLSGRPQFLGRGPISRGSKNRS